MTEDIQPFRVEVPEADVDYMHDRLATAGSPGEPSGTGWERGIPLGDLAELARYWRTGYD